MFDKDELKNLAPYLIFSVVIILFLTVKGTWIGIILSLAYIYFMYYLLKKFYIEREKSKEKIEQVVKDFDVITKKAIFNMPFPIVVTHENGDIFWYNSLFLNEFSKETLTDSNITGLMSEVDIKKIIDNNLKEIFVKINDKEYKANITFVESEKDLQKEKILMFYFIDRTSFKELEKKYVDEYPILAKIELDNYDEAMDSTPSANRPSLIAEIDEIINLYFKDHNALVRKYDSDMYLVILSYKSLREIKEKKFDLLDDLRELDKGNSIPITLSIGVSSFGLDFTESYKEADRSLDLALGRGGDQAVVKVKDNYEFFGGKSKAVEKRNKVKARVLGIALKQLIDGADNIFIMGHKNADMDAIGSAIGVLRAVLNRGKQGYIVLNSSNPSIENLLKRMETEEPENYKRIVKENFALDTINAKSLLILVDNNKPSLTESPKLIELTPQIVVIDHHRRGTEFVENPVLTYIEPYASSSCELVTEMLTYMNDELKLSHFEADALMSGIVVDTKNFKNQTGVRTFEAASILKRAGADMIKVKQLFEDDLDTLLSRAEVIHNTKIIFDFIAISKLERQAENSMLVAAQAADELLEINGIDASFVMTNTTDGVHISARSRGEFSVQLILEKIGGGGHLNMAGAKIKGKSIEETQEILMDAIKEYLEDVGDKK